MSTWNPKANDIFLHAVELGSAADRRQYLDAACAGDEPLRAEVEALLAAGDQAGSFLESPAVAPPLLATVEQPIAERPGTMIGPYKLLEQIGEGGFGVVFMAEQQQPVRLKVLKPGMDTRQVVARFEAERQALAIMDHPNIAKVHDGGATPSGRPYFVMELVKGVPITEFCDQNQLAPRQRLELFIHVCQAVQHAHQKGIIHRDLKPSNILVVVHDTTPVVKVIDFGVAKALGQELTDKTLFTGFAQMVGTPLYMSPEQAGQSGLDVDTRSDIYSLGVLLYELLTGTTPFTKEQFRAAGYDEIRRIIREEEPPKPSTRISTLGQAASTVSTNRKSDPKHLGRLLRGEVDWIVMKALEKDRNRRYETANGLARDIERYLHDEPVHACPPSTWYRFRKFARRKKVALAMAACVFLALSGIAGGGGWLLRDRASRRWESEATTSEILKAVQPRLWEGQTSDAALGAAALRVEEMLQSDVLGPEVRRRAEQFLRDVRMLNALDEIRLRAAESNNGEMWDWAEAEVRYAAAFAAYGLDPAAVESAQAAEFVRQSSIREALLGGLDAWLRLRKEQTDWLRAVADGADDNAWRRAVREATLTGDIKRLQSLASDADALKQPPDALTRLASVLEAASLPKEAEAVLRKAQRRYPGDFWVNYDLGHLLVFGSPARPDEAVGYFRAAVAIRPRSAEARSILGIALFNADIDGAIAAFRDAIAIAPEFPIPYDNLGSALRHQKRHEEAIAAYRQAIALSPKFANAYQNLGHTLANLGQFDEAIVQYSKAAELNPTSVSVWEARSGAFLDAGQHDKALADAEKAVEILRKRIDMETGPTRANLRLDLAHSLWHMERVLSSAAMYAEAETTLREALEIIEELASERPAEGLHAPEADFSLRQFFDELANAQTALASRCRSEQRLGEAEKIHRAAIDIYRRLGRQSLFQVNAPTWLGRTCCGLAAILRQTGRSQDANELCLQVALECRSAVARNREVFHDRSSSRDDWELAGSLESLAALLNDLGELSAAESCYRDANAIWQKLTAFSNNEDYRFHLGINYDALGAFLRQHGRAAEAVESYRAARAIWEKLVAEFNHEDRRMHLAWTTHALGELAEVAGQFDDAAAAYREAAEVWQKLAADFPSNGWYAGRNSELLLYVGHILRRQQRHQDAEQAYRLGLAVGQRAADARPEDVWSAHLPAAALYHLADLLLETNQLDAADEVASSAVDIYEQLIQDFPDNALCPGEFVHVVSTLANARLREHRAEDLGPLFERARNDLAGQTEKFPNSREYQAALNSLLDLYNNLASELAATLESLYSPTAENGRDNEAEQVARQAAGLYEKLATESPSDLKTRLGLGRCFEYLARVHGRTGRLDNAVHDLRSVDDVYAQLAAEFPLQTEYRSQPPGIRLVLGHYFNKAGRLKEAAAIFADAAAAYEQLLDDIAAHAGAAPMTAAGVPTTAKDIAWYRHELGYVLVWQGYLLSQLGQLPEAEAALKRGLEVHESLMHDPESPADAKARLGWNEVTLARLYYERAANLAREGAAEQSRGKFREAIAAYIKAIELAPDNAQAHNNLAWLYATCPEVELRDPAKAVALAKKAVELRPTEGTGWNTLGAAQYRAGEWQAAVESLTKSMELRSGGDAFDWYFLAMAHCRLGHVDDARKWHQQAVEWEEKNAPLLASNRQMADELRRFRAEAEELLGEKEP